MSNWTIPLSDLDYGPEEEAAVLRVLRSRWLSMGPEVQAFEREFAEMTGVRHAFAVANGTAALFLAYAALGIQPGDEIIQPALNFVAAANMTVAVGAKPIFADICSLDEPSLDPASVERLINPRTRAVVVMHYGGYFCRMDEFQALCRSRGLALIEDACHAVGGRYASASPASALNGRAAGVLSDVACFSFFANKNLPVGEGGMVTTDRDDLAEILRSLRSHGMTTLTWDRHKGHAYSYDVTLHGYNYRLDELRAALGREQLKKLESGNARRKALVTQYRQGLANVARLQVPFKDGGRGSAYHLMPVLAADAAHRKELVSALGQARIQSSLHYPDIPRFTIFQKDGVQAMPISRSFSERVITLPLFPHLQEEQVAQVVATLASV